MEVEPLLASTDKEHIGIWDQGMQYDLQAEAPMVDLVTLTYPSQKPVKPDPVMRCSKQIGQEELPKPPNQPKGKPGQPPPPKEFNRKWQTFSKKYPSQVKVVPHRIFDQSMDPDDKAEAAQQQTGPNNARSV